MDCFAFERLCYDGVRHGRGRRGAVPVFLTWRDPDDIPLPDFLDRATQRCTRPQPVVTIRV
jgi:hypothetical protein